MRKYRSEIGWLNGKRYKLIHDKRGNQHHCDDEYKNHWRWFLWIGGNSNNYYRGDFRTKAEALSYISIC